jgi:hypothetical protein
MTTHQHLRFLKASTGLIREDTLNGQAHVVVPMVMLRQGVFQCANCDGPEYYPASQFGKYPTTWNGRPITLDHPRDDKGEPVSASETPSLFEKNTIGFLFNTKLDGERLVSEAWINKSAVENMAGGEGDRARELIKALEEGDPVDVSTGYFMELDSRRGTYNGQRYNGVQQNYVPDHLAMLPLGVQGACSWADGCGAGRVNSAALKALAEGIDGISQFRAESSACSGHEDCGCGCKGHKHENHGNAPGQATKLLSAVGAMLFGNRAELSTKDLMVALESALRGMGDDYRYCFPITAYTDKQKLVYVDMYGDYYTMGYSIGRGGQVTLDGKAKQVRPVTTYVPVVTSDTSTSTTEDLEVNTRATTTSDPNIINTSDGTRNLQVTNQRSKKDIVDSLIACGAFNEDDRNKLANMGESELNVVEQAIQRTRDSLKDRKAGEVPQGVSGQLVSSITDVAATTTNSAKQHQQQPTVDEFLASAPAPIAAMMRNALNTVAARRTSLIAAITGNSRNRFTKEQLEGMTDDALEGIAVMASPAGYEANYAGQGVFPATNAAANAGGQQRADEGYVPAPSVFDVEALEKETRERSNRRH